MDFFRKMSKKQKITLGGCVGGILAVAITAVAVYFAVRQSPPVAEPLSSELTVSESVTEPTTEPTTATDVSKTAIPSTTAATKPPAAPITKVYKPKPTAAPPKPQQPSVKKVKLNTTVVSQFPKYPTGCEGASATILLKYYGYGVTLDEMINAIPREDLYKENGRVYGPSIYEKFVGDPRQTYTDERAGYGAFSPVITRALNDVLAKKKGRQTAKNITGCSFNTLLKHLDNGDPLIVWATAKMQTPQYVNSWYIKRENGKDKYFEYPRGTHVMVLSGYDGKYVYITDPIYGNVKYTYAAFNDKWVLLGKQAIVLTDGAPPTTAPPATSENTEPVTNPPAETSTSPVTEPLPSTKPSSETSTVPVNAQASAEQ